jgi:hypothetical protein
VKSYSGHSTSTPPPAPKPYLTRGELAKLVGDWTPKAISRLIEKGLLRLGEHYFIDPRGRGYLFRWDRIVDLIESGAASSGCPIGDEIPMLAGGVLGNGGAKDKAHGL